MGPNLLFAEAAGLEARHHLRVKLRIAQVGKVAWSAAGARRATARHPAPGYLAMLPEIEAALRLLDADAP